VTRFVQWLGVGLALVSCGPPPSPALRMPRFNAALCPALPREDLSRPLDPNLDGVKARIDLPTREVKSPALVRLSITYTNGGLKGVKLSLPQDAFTVAGFNLVDHACVPVRYGQPPTSKALAYRDTGPMPLNPGESATIDANLGDLAPGLILPPGIYALRLALRIDAAAPVVRGATVRSDWALFAVLPPSR